MIGALIAVILILAVIDAEVESLSAQAAELAARADFAKARRKETEARLDRLEAWASARQPLEIDKPF